MRTFLGSVTCSGLRKGREHVLTLHTALYAGSWLQIWLSNRQLHIHRKKEQLHFSVFSRHQVTHIKVYLPLVFLQVILGFIARWCFCSMVFTAKTLEISVLSCIVLLSLLQKGEKFSIVPLSCNTFVLIASECCNIEAKRHYLESCEKRNYLWSLHIC